VIERLFGSKLRAKLLGWLMTHPEERYFVRQLTAILHEDSTNVSRELARLARMGLLTCRQEGRQKYYQANRQCPVFEELQGLAVKTIGLGDVLRAALEPIAGRIRVAFLFGSFAQRKETADSDVDLLAVGEVGSAEMAKALRPARAKLSREINVTVYPPREFSAKAKAGHHFIAQVLKGDKIYLVGSEDDLKRLAG
jgi:DNA-binding transcriptional ArsR family regulator